MYIESRLVIFMLECVHASLFDIVCTTDFVSVYIYCIYTQFSHSFIKIYFTYHKTYSRKVDNSVVFIMFRVVYTQLCVCVYM